MVCSEHPLTEETKRAVVEKEEVLLLLIIGFSLSVITQPGFDTTANTFTFPATSLTETPDNNYTMHGAKR
jgi:hypothetical protein